MFEKTRTALLLIIFTVALGSLILFLSSARDIYVDVNYKYPDSDGSVYHPYKSIQYAIDQAEDGDSIYVFAGVYNETLVVDKSVKIQAIDKHNVTIWKNDKNRYTIEILADMVAIEDLKIIADGNCYVAAIYIAGNTVTIQGNCIIINGTAWAIYIDSSTGDTIGSNIIDGGKGMWLRSSTDTAFVNNEIVNSTDAGIKIQNSLNTIIYGNKINLSRYSIYAQDCSNLNITNNTMWNNKVSGIEIQGGDNAIIAKNVISDNPTGIDFHSDNGEIKNNSIENNDIGIFLGGTNTQIYGNNITKSDLYGIYAEKGSYDNTIYKNIFMDNSVNAIEKGENLWDNGEIGNFWDDYNEVDRDQDGIGDYPYDIPGGGVDRYPTGAFLKPPDKPELIAPKDGETNVGLNPTLQVKVTDPDSSSLSVYFYDASNDELIGERHSVPNEGTASLSFRLPYDTVMAWYVVVNDSKLETTSDIWTFSTLPVPPANDRPIADPGGPYSGNINEPIQFNASGSYDPDGEIVFYRWNFGDGSGEILDPNPSHIYQKEGTYVVTLTVIDNNGTSDTKTTEVEISKGETKNTPPVSNPGGPYSGNINEPIQFNASGSYDPDGEIVEYTWDFGDGSVGYGVNPTHSYSKSGIFEVKLTVKDDDGKTSSSTTYVKISEKKKTPGFDTTIIIFALLITSLISLMRKR